MKASHEKYTLWTIVGLFVGVLLVITIYPFIYTVYLSFFEWNLARGLQKYFCRLDNFVFLLFDSGFWNSIGVTIIFTATAVSLQLLIALGLALLLQGETERIPAAVRTCIILPVLMAPVAIGLIFTTILDADYGVFNYILGKIGLPGRIAWRAQISTALLTCLAVDTWQWSPFMFLILFAGLQSLPLPIFEAAQIDGASSWQTFRYVTIPLLMPVILVAVLIRAIEAFKTFDMIFLLTHGGPSRVTETLSIFTYRTAFSFWRFGRASASAVLMLVLGMLMVIAVIGLLQKES